jgi:hypothetical protein
MVARWFLFQTKNPNLGKFWRALDGKMLIYFMAIWKLLQTFGIFYDHLVHTCCVQFVHFSGLGIMCQEKSGNPASGARTFYIALLVSKSGLPDFSWCNIPKREKYTKITIKCTKLPQNIPNDHILNQMAIKYTNIFNCQTLRS